MKNNSFESLQTYDAAFMIISHGCNASHFFSILRCDISSIDMDGLSHLHILNSVRQISGLIMTQGSVASPLEYSPWYNSYYVFIS